MLQKVNRVRFKTDIGDITHKPRKKVTETEDFAGFKTTEVVKKFYEFGEFVTNNPMLNELNANCKKEPQAVVVSYAEMINRDNPEEEVRYKFMRDFQWETIYYSSFHKDKQNLEKQQERAKKFAK